MFWDTEYMNANFIMPHGKEITVTLSSLWELEGIKIRSLVSLYNILIDGIIVSLTCLKLMHHLLYKSLSPWSVQIWEAGGKTAGEKWSK